MGEKMVGVAEDDEDDMGVAEEVGRFGSEEVSWGNGAGKLWVSISITGQNDNLTIVWFICEHNFMQ